MENNYEETFYIRILCIANNELKVFNLGNVLKRFSLSLKCKMFAANRIKKKNIFLYH